MLNTIKSTLEKDPRVSSWTIQEVLRNSHQIYTSLSEQEAIRAVAQKQWIVSLYTPVTGTDGTPLIGHTQLDIAEGDRHLSKRIDAAIEQAQLHGSPLFSLPAPGAVYPDFEDSDVSIRDKPWETLGQISDEIQQAVEREKHIELSSSELFLNHLNYHLVSSNGLDLKEERSELLWDVCLLFNDGRADTEFWEMKNRRGLSSVDFKADIARFAQYARDAAVAVVPKSGVCPVVLTGDNLYILLQYFVHHSSAGAKYNNSALFEPGQSVLPKEPKADRLSFASNALHPGGLGSYIFDDEGTPGSHTPIIENGILKQYWGTSQYAGYLGLKPTGAFGNIEIPSGTLPWNDLFISSDRVILVHQFSTFDPQPVAGNYLGEIRVGYEFRADGSIVPLRGGSVTGNVVEGMLDCRFSKELETFYKYHGPRGIRFERAQVAGD